MIFRSALFVLVIAAVGCGESRKTAYLQDQTEPPKSSGEQAASQPDLRANAEASWEQREDTAKLQEAIASYERIVADNPADRETLIRLSRACYFLANGHLQDDAAILDAYDKGAGYGEQAMAINPKFKEAIVGGTAEKDALQHLTKEDVGGLYWAYSNLGKWSVKKGFTTVLKYKSKLKAFVDRVVELDPNYFHGAGDRGLAAFYVKAPDFAGGDLKKAKTHFSRSMEIAPNYFGTKVLIAEYYAVKKQDKEMFQKILQEVLAADPAVIPEIVPEQKAEQNNAKRLLAKMDDLFE